jgi:hypothetical protein
MILKRYALVENFKSANGTIINPVLAGYGMT